MHARRCRWCGWRISQSRGITSLSGGQQQRIAVARSIAVKPALLLLDEPFSALDRKLRETMQIELRRLLRDLGITSIFVTHDQDEALVMSDRIAVMNEGRIEHLGVASEIYGRPKSLFVLEFVGQSTRLRGTRRAIARRASSRCDTALGRVRSAGSFLPDSEVVIAVRPEAVMLGEGPESEFNNHPRRSCPTSSISVPRRSSCCKAAAPATASRSRCRARRKAR